MRIGRIVMGVFYIVAGTGHFVVTRLYESIMPSYLPAHHELVMRRQIAGHDAFVQPRRDKVACARNHIEHAHHDSTDTH